MYIRMPCFAHCSQHHNSKKKIFLYICDFKDKFHRLIKEINASKVKTQWYDWYLSFSAQFDLIEKGDKRFADVRTFVFERSKNQREIHLQTANPPLFHFSKSVKYCKWKSTGSSMCILNLNNDLIWIYIRFSMFFSSLIIRHFFFISIQKKTKSTSTYNTFL